MIIGRMKHRLKILQAVRNTDRFGAKKTTWEVYKTIHAERVQISGNRVNENGESFADYRTQFNVRDLHNINGNMRCQQVGDDKVFAIAAILDHHDRGYLTLICERVNE